MDYRRVKSGREKGLVYLAVILTAVILVQCVINIVLTVSNRQTKVMFEEALQGQLSMQEEINSLKEINSRDSGEITDDNTEDGAEENGNQ